MTLPAARVADMHVCPMVTGVVPHVGGPIITPTPTVLIGMMPAATATAMAVCVGPPDIVAKGSMTVLTGKKPQARMGDTCAHGGAIVIGCMTVLVGG
ncbi:PAAR domain-containing protein [uncultured Tateyamaria sp.]|uniref:PAAR domain-containing protein n=1 Tax=uncultured Tateyamaria sp. TaxID=455651 RepID=UPI0026061965|nr:PAAR domain-containing protein [uncultured Tateyamaria sp.]